MPNAGRININFLKQRLNFKCSLKNSDGSRVSQNKFKIVKFKITL